MTAKKTGIVLGVVAAAGVAAAAFAGAGGMLPDLQRGSVLPITQVSSTAMFQPPPGAPNSFADIFEKVSPAVVSIDVKSRLSAADLRELLPFGGGRRGVPGGADGLPPEVESSGSGFFISGDGYIVTNNHVVENASEITVTLKDDRKLKAEVVGRDRNTDLAVLKVPGRNFPFVNFENKAKPRVGDWVITIGNPFGLGGTATVGIVSAYGRNLEDADPESSQFVDYIQVDAPINRGNSGGPTFDVYGRVIGVNSAIYSPTGNSVGIGFAIPSEIAENVVKSLISKGQVSRGYLGITPETLAPEMAASLPKGLLPSKDVKGVLVADVRDDGPAKAAGLETGDIITQVNDRAVATSNELTRIVAATQAGDNLKLEILRAGRPQTINVKSGVRPDILARNDAVEQVEQKSRRTPSTEERVELPLGLRVSPLDESTRRSFNVGVGVRGVVVESVQPGAEAARKNISRGYVIVSVNLKPVNSPEEFAQAVADAQKEGAEQVMLLAHFNGAQGYVTLKTQG